VCCDACATESGRKPNISGVAYYSDATVYAASYGVPFAIVGPGELGMSGQPNEFVEIEKIIRAVEIYRRIAEEWLCEARRPR
jgi:succinyl-diaminopimelate desuccinylase